MLFVTLAVMGVSSACGSSSKSNSSSTTTNGSCPFSGSMSEQSTPAGPVPNVVLESVSPRRAGCIDQLQFNFKPAVAASQVAYQGDTPTLRVKLLGASLGSGSQNNTTVPPDGLAYVTSIKIDASAATGEVDWLITLDQQRQFLTSSAQAPPYLQVAIG